MHRTFAVTLIGLTLAAQAVHAGPAARTARNELVHVVAPLPRDTVRAHPFVNVIVGFGLGDNGLTADASTFRARLGRTNITDRFHPITENGVVVGARAAIEPPLVRVGRRVNLLRFDIRSLPRKGPGSRVHDVDRVRFRAVAAANQAPVARLAAPSDVLFPDTSVQFDGSLSHDPDQDELTYYWDFGDDDHPTDARPHHTFTGGNGDVTVRLTVSDGVLTSTDQETLVECPATDPDRTPGFLRIEPGPDARLDLPDSLLEFGAVTPGASAQHTITVVNTDQTSTSQLRGRLRVEGPAFTVSPDVLDLAAGASATLTLTFAPTTAGHQSANVVVVASGANRCAVHLLAHGFGGSAPSSGPTLAAAPVFYGLGSDVGGIMPSGARFTVDTTTSSCQSPGGGPGTLDVCFADADCAANGGTCDSTTPAPPNILLGMCSNGAGSLFLLLDNSYTDPDPQNEAQLTSSIVRLDLDQQGNRIGGAIIARETDGTERIACDGRGVRAGGRLYTAEAQSGDPACFRIALQELVSLRQDGGGANVLVPRIDAAEKLDACQDDLDAVWSLDSSRDGLDVFASLEGGGLYQLRPTIRKITSSITDAFEIHPDGDIVYVRAEDKGTSGILKVYKISPDQAADGTPLIEDLTPCATFKVANNTSPNTFGSRTVTGEHSIAIGPASIDSLDGILLVSFVSSGGVSEAHPALSPRLQVQGTVAFAIPAGLPTCAPLGFVNLDILDPLTF